MCDMIDIEEAIEVVKNQGNQQLSLLQCGSVYPLPIKYTNLNVISSLNLLRCISLKSAWIDGGIIKSAPRQKPVTQDTTIKGIISPESNKKTEVNKQDDKIREIDQVSFFPNFLLIYVQKGTPSIANKK